MGMAYQTISSYNSPPVFQTLLAQKQVTTPVFSFKLSTSGAELFLGGTDSKLFTGNFTYTPVTTQVSPAEPGSSTTHERLTSISRGTGK